MKKKKRAVAQLSTGRACNPRTREAKAKRLLGETQYQNTTHTHKRLKLQEKRSALRMLPTENFPGIRRRCIKITHSEHITYAAASSPSELAALGPGSCLSLPKRISLPFPLSFTAIAWCLPVCHPCEPSHGRTQACLSCPKALLAAFCSDILAHAELQFWTCQGQPGTQGDKTVC